MDVDIYGIERKLTAFIKRIEKSGEIQEESKREILSFYSYCLANGLSRARVLKLLGHLYSVALMLGKSFAASTKQDVMRLVQGIESRGLSPQTKWDYRIALKKFYRWLRQTEESPEEVRWIKCGNKSSNMLPEELLTEEDIKRLIFSASNVRDRALISVLYESGCRIGELLTLRIKNVQFDEYGAILIVDGKTGARRVRIISSASALATWLNSHPFRDNPDAPLWIGVGTRSNRKPLKYGAVRTQLIKIAKRAGVRKGINPHSFRHARATHLANKLTEAQMKEYFGWVQSSDMASVYVHLSGRDVDNALLRLHGLGQDERKVEDVLKLKVCSRCQERNDPISSFCRRCASPLDVKIAMELDEKTRKKDEAVAQVMAAVIEELRLEEMIYRTIKRLKLEGEF